MSFHHNKANLVALKLLSKFALIPFDFIPKTGKIRKWASLWKFIVWHFLGASFVFCTIYLWVQFGLQIWKPPEDLNLSHLSVHFIFSLLNAFTVYLIYEYRRHSNDIIVVWNGAMGNAETADDDDDDRRSTPFDLRNCTLQEALIQFLPELWIGLILVVVPFILSDPTRPQLYYHIMGATIKEVGVGGYALFGFLEISMTIFMSSSTFIYAYIQLVFLQNCSSRLKNETRKLKSAGNERSTGKESLRKALRSCRQIEILICLFNQSNSKMIFATKIMLLSISISGLFFAIKFHDDQPLIASFNGLFGLTYTFFYTVIYEKAFQIPALVKEYKNVILLVSVKQSKNKEQKTLRWGKRVIPQPQVQVDSFIPEMSREIASISNIGIQVGAFHTMERMSTLIFIDFVVRNVATLLITFM